MADEIKIELVADADGVIKAVQKIGPEAEKAGNKLNKGIKKADKTGKKLVETFSKFSGIVGGLAFGAAFTKAIKDFAEFESRIAEVNTLLPKTNKVTKKTENAIKDLGAQFGKSNADLAAAYYDVISAGSQDAAESLELLTGATKASVVGVTDVKTATGAILSVINAYGKENITATEASEKLFAVVQQGRTTFPELASNIGDIVPVASQLGISLDELGGFLAVSTRVSGNTSKSVTQLSAAFNSILKPTDEAKKVIKALNKETGAAIDFSATALKEQGLEKFFKRILDATKGYKNQQAILAKIVGSTEGLKGVLTVTGDAFDDVKKSIDAVSKSAGVLDEGFKDIDDTLSKKFDKTISKSGKILDGLASIFSDIAKPALGVFNDVLDDIIKKQKELQDESEKTGGAYRDFLGRGAVQPETFSPEAAIPFQMGQEGVDPTGALIDSIVGMAGTEGDENPMMVFASQSQEVAAAMGQINAAASESATSVFNLDKALGKISGSGGDKDGKDKKGGGGTVDNTIDKFKQLKKSLDSQFTNGVVKSLSVGIQQIGRSLTQGAFNFEQFGRMVAGIFGDMAIQMGETALLTGLTMEALGKLSGGEAIAAGLGLIALGTVLKSFAGSGGGGAVSSIPSGVAPAGDSATSTIGPLDDISEEEENGFAEPETIEKQQQVQVVVQGDILDNGDETATRILNILNENFDSKGGRIAYA